MKYKVYYIKFTFTDIYMMHIIYPLIKLSFWRALADNLSRIKPTSHNVYVYCQELKKVTWYGTIKELKENLPNASFVRLSIVDFLWMIS